VSHGLLEVSYRACGESWRTLTEWNDTSPLSAAVSAQYIHEEKLHLRDFYSSWLINYYSMLMLCNVLENKSNKPRLFVQFFFFGLNSINHCNAWP